MASRHGPLGRTLEADVWGLAATLVARTKSPFPLGTSASGQVHSWAGRTASPSPDNLADEVVRWKSWRSCQGRSEGLRCDTVIISYAAHRASWRISSGPRGRMWLRIGGVGLAKRPPPRKTARQDGDPRGIIVGAPVAASESLRSPPLLFLFPSLPARMRPSLAQVS